MKTNRLIWALGWATMGSLAALQGCGGDDDDGGTGGKAGSSGSAGKGGSSGKGGTAGQGGSSGKGGSSGQGGSGQGGSSGATSGAGGAPGGAGGEGGGASGDRVEACADYCEAYFATCESYTTNRYDDEADCNVVCADAPWELGDPGDGAGDTVHCRLTHAGYAADMDPELHCDHSSYEPSAVCI
jgi:hypothetical protein